MSNIEPGNLLRQRLAREIKTRSLNEAMSDNNLLNELSNNYPEFTAEFASLASVATGLVAEASFTVPLLLDFTHPNGTKRAAVVPLTLMLIPTGAPRQWEGWVPDPASAAIQIDSEFNASLTGTRVRLNSLDPEYPLWPENANFHIRWHIPPDAHVGTLSGRSADCIIALGVIELLRKAQHISSDNSLSCHIRTWTPASWHCLSASAQVDEYGIVRPVPAAPLQRKFASSVKGSVDTILVNLPPDQSHLSAAQAASAPELIHITSLQEAVFYLAMRSRPPSAAKQRSLIRRRVFFSVTAVCVLLALSTACWWGLWVSYPSAGVLRQRLPMATIDQTPLPLHCKHLIVIPKLSKEVWKKQVFPTLKWIRSPYALVIGNPQEPPNDADQYALEGLDELKTLRSLALLGAGVNDLPGLDQLSGLEQLIIANSCVRSVMFAADLLKLRILVLDSPWLQAVPREWDLPQAEIIVVHTNSLNDAIYLTCPKLRSLTICSEHLERFSLPGSPVLEELMVGAPRLNSWSVDHPVPSLRRLTLVTLPPFEGDRKNLDLVAFPKLEELHIKGGKLKELNGVSSLSCLRELDVEDTPELQIKGLEQMTSLRKLKLSFVPKMRLTNIGALIELQELTITNGDLSMLTGIDHLKSAESIYLDGDAEAMPRLPPLTELKDLSSLNLPAGTKVIPILGAAKLCYVSVFGPEVQDGRDGSIIKKNELDQLVWHPETDGKGWFENKDSGYYGSYIPGYLVQVHIEGVPFFLLCANQPVWDPGHVQSIPYLDLHHIDWSDILLRQGVEIGSKLERTKVSTE